MGARGRLPQEICHASQVWVQPRVMSRGPHSRAVDYAPLRTNIRLAVCTTPAAPRARANESTALVRVRLAESTSRNVAAVYSPMVTPRSTFTADEGLCW